MNNSLHPPLKSVGTLFPAVKTKPIQIPMIRTRAPIGAVRWT